MRAIHKIILASTILLFAHPAFAVVNIFACEPEWAALAQQLAGPQANIYTATTALQDPHHIEARPSLIAKARRANLVVCTGAELEIAWLPVVLRESGNDAIAPGRPGYFEAAQFVHLLEVPTHLDRAEGDVHPAGNPHIQLDARNYLPIAKALADRLTQLDPAHATAYQQRQAEFAKQWRAAIVRWEKQAAPLRGLPIVVQHRAFPYLNAWLGMKEIAALEPKPGMEPSAAHLAQVLAQLQQQPARMVVRAAYQNPTPSEWMSARARIPTVVLPFSVGGSDGAKDLFGLFDDTIAQLLAGLQ